MLSLVHLQAVCLLCVLWQKQRTCGPAAMWARASSRREPGQHEDVKVLRRPCAFAVAQVCMIVVTIVSCALQHCFLGGHGADVTDVTASRNMQSTVRASCRLPSCQTCCKIVCAWLLPVFFSTRPCFTVSVVHIQVRMHTCMSHGAGDSDGVTKRKRVLEPEQRDVPAKAPKSQAGSQQPAMPPPPALPLCKHSQLDLHICKNGAHKGRSFFCCRLPLGEKARCESAFIWLCDTPVGLQLAALAQTRVSKPARLPLHPRQRALCLAKAATWRRYMCWLCQNLCPPFRLQEQLRMCHKTCANVCGLLQQMYRDSGHSQYRGVKEPRCCKPCASTGLVCNVCV